MCVTLHTLQTLIFSLCVLVGVGEFVGQHASVSTLGRSPSALGLRSLLVLRGGNGIDGRESARVGMSAKFQPPRSDVRRGRERDEKAGAYVPGPLAVPAPDLEQPLPRVHAAQEVPRRAAPGAPTPYQQVQALKRASTESNAPGKKRAMSGTNKRPSAQGTPSALDTIRARLLQLSVEHKGVDSVGSQEERSRDTTDDAMQWLPDHTKAAAGRNNNLQQLSTPKNKLTADQELALEAVKKGHNIFLTGSAGTGKSFVLRHLIGALKRRHGNNAVHVTASTGAAAVLIGGTTLHAFAGIGLGKEDAATLVKKVYANKLTSGRWQRARALVIDEVSMIDCDLFDKIDYVARQLKTAGRPFGGLQIIVCGDFFQLPPVTAGSGSATGPKRFAFQSKAWSRAVQETVELKRVMRQGEEKFVRVLNELRWGKVSAASSAALLHCQQDRSRSAQWSDGVELTKLYPYNVNVRAENEKRLKSLPGELLTFKAEDLLKGRGASAQRLDALGACACVRACVCVCFRVQPTMVYAGISWHMASPVCVCSMFGAYHAHLIVCAQCVCVYMRI